MSRLPQSVSIALIVLSGCVVPVRETLPALDGTLVDGTSAVSGASVRYTWDFGAAACTDASTTAITDAAGHFAFAEQRWWDVGVITPIPGIGRSGWQLCFESPDGRARYFTMLAEPRAVSVACDLARSESDGACEVTWR